MFQKIKILFSLAGINNLAVKFEPENQLIRVHFVRAGEQVEETIAFKQVEDFFAAGQEGPQMAQDGKTLPSG